MKITTIEPKRPQTLVVIEMTDEEAIELRDYINPDDIDQRCHRVVHGFFKLLHDLISEW